MASVLISEPGKRRTVVVRYFLVWTAAGLFYFGQARIQSSLSQNPNPWWRDFATWMTGMYICAALTPVILWLNRRIPIERKGWLKSGSLHLLFSLAFSAVELAIHSAVILWFRLLPDLTSSFVAVYVALLRVAFQQNVVTYWVILGISRTIRMYRKFQEREKESLRLELAASEMKARLARAQMSALKAQLQPHFLFNTLNAVMVLVRQRKGPEAEETLARLSDLLRFVLEDVESQQVPLSRELEFVRLYLSIEQVRFQDRLRIDVLVGPEAREAAVPHMLLQPIVENAVRHGIGRSSSAGRIEIRAERVDGRLKVEVRDDGPGLGAAPPGAAHGIGLANTRARLRQMYGDSARLTLENAPDRGAVATVVLPFAVAGEEAATGSIAEHAADNVAG